MTYPPPPGSPDPYNSPPDPTPQDPFANQPSNPYAQQPVSPPPPPQPPAPSYGQTSAPPYGQLARLGKHSTGKSCLYLKRLSDMDTDVLRELVREGFQQLNGKSI